MLRSVDYWTWNIQNLVSLNTNSTRGKEILSTIAWSVFAIILPYLYVLIGLGVFSLVDSHLPTNYLGSLFAVFLIGPAACILLFFYHLFRRQLRKAGFFLLTTASTALIYWCFLEASQGI